MKKGKPRQITSKHNSNTYYKRGNKHYEKCEYKMAIYNYNMAVLLNPHSSKAYFKRALSAYQLKNFDYAIKEYTKSAKFDPKNPKIYANRGDAYYGNQEYELAIKDYKKALKLNPKNKQVKEKLNECSQKAKGSLGKYNPLFYDIKRSDYVKRAEYLTKKLAEKADDKLYSERALCHYHQKNYEKAIKDYTMALKLKKNAEYYVNLGSAQYMNQDYDLAIKNYEKALKLENNNLKALYDLGLSLASIEKYEEAMPAFNRLISIKPNFGRAYYMRGKCFEYMGNLIHAKYDYQKVISLGKDFVKDSEEDLRLLKDKEDRENMNTLDSGLKGTIDPATLAKKPSIKLSEVGGMKELKEGRINEILSLLNEKMASLAGKYGISFGGGILFYGPPGCGKSFVTEAIAGETGVHFIKASISDTLNLYVGNSEKNLHSIFEYARMNQPAIIFFDEMEALGGNRENMSEHFERALVNQFLVEMDQVEKSNEKILVMGATNAPWRTDHALKRSGRFSETIFIGPPDSKSRIEVFKLYCNKIKLLDKIDYEKLSAKTSGFSCADIKSICNEAARRVWMESVKGKVARKVKTDDILAVIEKGVKNGRFRTVREWLEIAKRNTDNLTFGEDYPDLVELLKDSRHKKVEGMFG